MSIMLSSLRRSRHSDDECKHQVSGLTKAGGKQSSNIVRDMISSTCVCIQNLEYIDDIMLETRFQRGSKSFALPMRVKNNSNRFLRRR